MYSYYYSRKKRDVSELVGKTLSAIEVREDKITFACADGSVYHMLHDQECCEEVGLDDVCGDWEDLIGQPLIIAEKVSNYEPSLDEDKKKTEEYERYGSCTWTFYKFATRKGYVDVRWFGSSNGYYSEEVDFIRIDDEN